MDEIDLKKHAAEIAEEMGAGWSLSSIDYGDHMAILDGPDGACLFFRQGDSKLQGKIEISDRLEDKFKPYDSPDFRIRVSSEKSPKRVAGDIERRILSKGYWEVLAQTSERRRLHFEHEARQNDLVAALVKCLGPGAREFTHRKKTIGFGSYGSGISGEVHAHSSDVEFVLTVPAAQSQRFASMIAAIRQESVTVHVAGGES